jgi:glycine/D-amino acid oxidase-like deaminating enzyme
MMRIAVIGAGSVGAHVAYRLQQQGAEVVLIEAAEPGRGTSASSIAWLSSFPQRAWDEEPGKAALRPQSDTVFHELQREVPGDYLHWTGTLLWGSPSEREEFTRYAHIARERGVGVEIIDAAAARALDPAIRIDDDEVVFWEEGSGWVDGPAIVDALVDAFRMLGGTLRTGAPVVGFDIAGERVVGVRLGDGATIAVDAAVNAAGSWASHISAMADLAIPVDLVPGRILYTPPVAQGPARIINTPEWCGRPDPSGGYAIHWRGHSQTAHHGGNIASGEALMREVARTLPVFEGMTPVRSSIGIRPIPHGGPVVGAVPWLPNLYFTVSHGGIGWAPLWGWMAARELLHGEDVPELSAMRPERFYLEPARIGRHADDAEQGG